MAEKLSPSRETGVKTLFEAFKILKEEGGQLPSKEVVAKVEQRLKLSDWERGLYEKTGNVRWKSILQFYSIVVIKAGYLRKSKGLWYLTSEGEEAMKGGPIELTSSALSLYRKWDLERKSTLESEVKGESKELIDETIVDVQKANLDQLEDQAIDGIKQYIIQKTPYEFQDLVAALLRAMGYYTPFISPKGRDGGIDIIAFQDPLGIKTPRIKVQVKHYPENPIPSDTIRSLKGLVNSGEEVGIFVTSGRFSNDAERFAREANVHIKLINGEEFIDLWRQFYNQMPDEDKYLLPLQPIYYLGSTD